MLLLRLPKWGPCGRVQTGRRVAAAAAAIGLRNCSLARAPRRGQLALALQPEKLLLLEDMELQTNGTTEMEKSASGYRNRTKGTIQLKNLGENATHLSGLHLALRDKVRQRVVVSAGCGLRGQWRYRRRR